MLKFISLLIAGMNGQYEPIDNDLYTMTVVIYQESRGDGIASMVGVANNVVLRVKSKYYPDTVYGVVHQLTLRSCAYSWWCDGKKDVIDLSKPQDRQAFIQAGLVADAFLYGEEGVDIAGFEKDDVLLYHAIDANPDWADSNLTLFAIQMGSHMFYRESRNKPLR
jgi:hypothetical protein